MEVNAIAPLLAFSLCLLKSRVWTYFPRTWVSILGTRNVKKRKYLGHLGTCLSFEGSFLRQRWCRIFFEAEQVEDLIDCGFIPGTYKGYWPNVCLGAREFARRTSGAFLDGSQWYADLFRGEHRLSKRCRFGVSDFQTNQTNDVNPGLINYCNMTANFGGCP